MARVLVPLAPGFEEIEAVTVIDLLRRARIEVVVAALDAREVEGSRGVTVVADALLDEVLDRRFDLVALPGGRQGAEHLRADARVAKIVNDVLGAGGRAAAICAAPSVLAAAGVLEGRRATSFPGFLDDAGVSALEQRTEPVVVDGPIVTSRGPGTAMDFALELIVQLAGESVAREVEGPLQRPEPRFG